MGQRVIEDPEFGVIEVKTTRARSVKVHFADGFFRFEAPSFVPLSELVILLNEYRTRIRTRMQKLNAINRRIPTLEIGSKINVFGVPYELQAGAQFTILASTIIIPEAYFSDQKKLKKHLFALIETHFSAKFSALYLECAEVIATPPYPTYAFKMVKRYWGCYRVARHHIDFNYNLLAYPENVVKSIIFHELAHTRFLDHSIGFKSLLFSCEPNWKALKQVLSERLYG